MAVPAPNPAVPTSSADQAISAVFKDNAASLAGQPPSRRRRLPPQGNTLQLTDPLPAGEVQEIGLDREEPHHEKPLEHLDLAIRAVESGGPALPALHTALEHVFVDDFMEDDEVLAFASAAYRLDPAAYETLVLEWLHGSRFVSAAIDHDREFDRVLLLISPLLGSTVAPDDVAGQFDLRLSLGSWIRERRAWSRLRGEANQLRGGRVASSPGVRFAQATVEREARQHWEAMQEARARVLGYVQASARPDGPTPGIRAQTVGLGSTTAQSSEVVRADRDAQTSDAAQSKNIGDLRSWQRLPCPERPISSHHCLMLDAAALCSTSEQTPVLLWPVRGQPHVRARSTEDADRTLDYWMLAADGSASVASIPLFLRSAFGRQHIFCYRCRRFRKALYLPPGYAWFSCARCQDLR